MWWSRLFFCVKSLLFFLSGLYVYYQTSALTWHMGLVSHFGLCGLNVAATATFRHARKRLWGWTANGALPGGGNAQCAIWNVIGWLSIGLIVFMWSVGVSRYLHAILEPFGISLWLCQGALLIFRHVAQRVSLGLPLISIPRMFHATECFQTTLSHNDKEVASVSWAESVNPRPIETLSEVLLDATLLVAPWQGETFLINSWQLFMLLQRGIGCVRDLVWFTELHRLE
jgi:hypothetical protein